MTRYLPLLCLGLLFFTSCKNSDDVTYDDEINNFVWKSMNSWYNWQSNVPNLSNSKDDNYNSYNSFLNSYNEPNDLFNSLLYQQGEVDRFSWFIEDYVAQQQQFQGVSTSFGFSRTATRINDTDNIILFIRKITKNSPADKAGFKRGDIINGLNGTVMTTSNYNSVIANLNNNTVEFNFVENDGTTSLKDVTISKDVVTDNPVHLTKTFDNVNGKKVGYIVYNGFRNSYNDELNDAFATLASANIQELIVDLRLNGGGSVETSSYLASMIYPNATTSDVFANLNFNSKKTQYNNSYSFDNTMNIYNSDGDEIGTESINKITGLSRVYILTSSSTASASEMIINGLKPYIDVIVVGDTTYGKNVGSITLYDAPSTEYTDESVADSSHKHALQPIVFQIFNKNNQSDYTNGFEPDILVEEWKYWDAILPFGDENEVVLKAALNNIKGFSSKNITTSNNSEKIEFDIEENKLQYEMYITKAFIQ